MSLLNCEINFLTYIQVFCLFNIISMLEKNSELALDLDAVEVDVMNDSDEVEDI
jgi:hypothetical protein